MRRIKQLLALFSRDPHDDSHLYGWRRYEDGLLGRVLALLLMAGLLILLWRGLWWLMLG